MNHITSIGIFGDSYADPGPDSLGYDLNPNIPLSDRPDNFKSWPKKLFKYYNVGYFASGGTSIEYSYVNFLKYQSKFDKIIFVRTFPHRYTIFESNMEPLDFSKLSFEKKISEMRYRFSMMLGNLKQSKITTMNIKRVEKVDKTIIKQMHNMHEFKMENNFNDHLIFESITDSIKLRRPDTYFIDAFPIHNGPSLFTVTKADYHSVGSDVEDLDSRFCHLSLKQNEQLFNIVKNVIENKTNMSIMDHLHQDVFEKYFTVSKTKEEAGLL